MGSLGFTLADRLGAKSLPCSVPGCTRTWIQMAGKALALARSSEGPAMCEPCRKKAETLRDETRNCDRAGCAETWVWPADAQLRAFAAGKPAPKRLCDSCEGRLAALSDQEIPCSVEGCQRKGIFSARDQLLLGAPEVAVTAPSAMCQACAGVYGKIKDRAVPCAVRACRNKWSWSKDAQIQAYAAGLPNEAPKRLCESCQTSLGELAEKPVRCRTSGCKNTWAWSVREQLDVFQPGKPLPKPVHRMCQRCLETFAKLKDVERPCRRPGCKRTWTDKRGAQLARAVRGKTGDPFPRYCSECEKELGDLQDRQVRCKTDGCPGTWTWSREAQLAAGVRPLPPLENEGAAERKPKVPSVVIVGAPPLELTSATVVQASDVAPGVESDDTDGIEAGADKASAVEPSAESAATGAGEDKGPVAASGPSDKPQGGPGGKKRRRRHRRREVHAPARRCEACIEFLRDRKTLEIPCQQCATLIFWPPESQLQTKLGHWAHPTLCGACKRDLTEAARAAQREALRHPGGESASPVQQATEQAETDVSAPTVSDSAAATGQASDSLAGDGASPNV